MVSILFSVWGEKRWYLEGFITRKKATEVSVRYDDVLKTDGPTYTLDEEPWRWAEDPSCPSVPEDVKVLFLPLDEQHMLVYPAQEEDPR